MHNFTDFTRLNDKSCLNTLLNADEVMVNRTDCEERRNCSMLFVDVAIGKDDIVYAFINTLFCFLAKVFDSLAKSTCSLADFEEHRKFLCLETFISDVTENVELSICKNWLWKTNHLTVALVWSKDVSTYSTDIFCKRHNEFLTDWVDGRVSNLSKLLTEIVEEDLWLVRNDCKWSVVTHCCNWFLTCSSHWNNSLVDIFLTETEIDKFAFEVRNRVINLTTALKFFELNTVCVKPLAIRMLACETCLDFLIIINLAFLSIDHHDLTWLETSL